MNYQLHSWMLIILTCFYISDSAPLSGAVYTRSVELDGEDERPTSEILPLPQFEEETIIGHEFLENIYKCLKLRDEGKDLSVAGCVPGVFQTVNDIPESLLSDTVLGFIANSSVHDHNMTLTLKVSEQTFLDNVNSVHLRIYKEEVDPELLMDKCNLTNGLQLSLHILTPKKALIQNITLSYNSLLEEKWTDFTSFNEIYNSTLHSANETVLQLEIDIKDCVNLSLQDIGITTSKGKEPVLVVYAKEHDSQGRLEKILNDSIVQQREKRSVESSGTPPITDPDKCRLINHNISSGHIDPSNLFKGLRFELNFCSGQCTFPLPSQNSILHAEILAYFQLVSVDNPTSETSVTPPPCCVPTKYSPLTFIVKETDWNFMLQTLHNFSARECGCR